MATIFWLFHDERFHCPTDAALLLTADGLGSIRHALTGFHLDRDQKKATAGNDIYFPERLSISTGKNVVAFQP